MIISRIRQAKKQIVFLNIILLLVLKVAFSNEKAWAADVYVSIIGSVPERRELRDLKNVNSESVYSELRPGVFSDIEPEKLRRVDESTLQILRDIKIGYSGDNDEHSINFDFQSSTIFEVLDYINQKTSISLDLGVRNIHSGPCITVFSYGEITPDRIPDLLACIAMLAPISFEKAGSSALTVWHDGRHAEDALSKKNQAYYFSDALASVPYVREFLDLYPETIFKVSSNDNGKYYCFLIVAVYDRYKLFARIPMDLDIKNMKIIRCGKPRFGIRTVQEYERNRDEISPHGTYERMSGYRIDFSTEQWREIVKADGDLTFLSEDIATNDPLKEYQQQWRESVNNPKSRWIGLEHIGEKGER